MKKLKLIFCLIVTLICVYILFQKIDMKIVTHIYSDINYHWLTIATIIGIFKMWLTGVRWRYFGTFCRALPIKSSFRFYTIGTMINMILPFRLGDLLRARLIGQRLNIANSKILGTIASEHIVDFLVLCGVLLLGIFLYSFNWPSKIIPTIISFSTIIGGIFLLLFTLKKNENIKKIEKIFQKFFPARLFFLYHLIINFYLGFFQVKSVIGWIRILFLTSAIWLAQCLWIYMLFNTLGITASEDLGFEAVVIMVIMMSIAIMLPATPGYIGTYHLMIVFGLMQLEVSKSVAFSYAVLAHAHSVICAITVGVYNLWRSEVNVFSNIKKNSIVTEEA